MSSEAEPTTPPPEHGGDLATATARFGRPAEGWLDLSTGISPHPYPLPEPSAAAWHRLPEPDGLEAIAARYYAAPEPLPVPGSQAAIGLLPALWPASRVAIPEPEYAEHAAAWRRWGHRVERIAPQRLAAGPDADTPWEVLVLSHPNNPTGAGYPLATLRTWRDHLASRGGCLIADEAFADAEPAASLAPETGEAGLIVLRSLGKFFGLAGARVGFVLAAPPIRERLAAVLGPWPLAGPARQAAAGALADLPWQQAQRARLAQARAALAEALSEAGLPPSGGTALFQWVPCSAPRALQEALAHHGIWIRAFDDPPGVRLGLPGAPTDWQRLDRGLRALGRATGHATRRRI